MELLERVKRKLTEILSPHFLGREQEALVGLAAATLDEAQELVDEGDAGLQAQIDALRSEEGAGLIGIEDAGGYFTAIDVEGALEELAGKDITLEDKNVAGKWDFLQPVGLADGGFVANLTPASLSANRTYTFRDESGTVAFLADIPAQVNLIAGSNINISGTYPNLTISGTGGDGGTGVSTVNGMVGDVVLDAADVGAAPASHTHTIAQVSGLQAALNGKASSSHTHSASDITSGVLSTARLGTGTANSSRFLRGDGTWAEPPSGGGGGGGTVTSVNVSGGTGISATGGPITTTGTISLALSTNLQGWSGISPSSKANTSALNAKTNASDFTYVGGRSGGTYDSHFGSGSNFAYLYHSAAGQPSDAPFSPTSQAAVLHMGNTWGRVQLAISSETTPQVFVRGAGGNNWTTVWTSGNFDPNSKANASHTHAASDITSGTLNAARIPNLNASKITAGTLGVDRVPSLPASKITSGTFSTARIPNLSSSYVTTSGNQTSLSGNKTWTGDHSFATVAASGTVSSGNAQIRGGSAAAIFSFEGTTTGSTLYFRPRGTNSSTNQTVIDWNGNMTVGGNVTATNLTATSDTRLKYDITRKDPRQELLEFVKLYGWKWIDSKEEGLGVLAQDVQKVAPEYVHEDADGMLSVDKAGLAIEMVMAMMEKLDGSSD